VLPIDQPPDTDGPQIEQAARTLSEEYGAWAGEIAIEQAETAAEREDHRQART
jgi:hypothetical protein